MLAGPPGWAAPLGSITVPRIVPLVNWALAYRNRNPN